MTTSLWLQLAFQGSTSFLKRNSSGLSPKITSFKSSLSWTINTKKPLTRLAICSLETQRKNLSAFNQKEKVNYLRKLNRCEIEEGGAPAEEPPAEEGGEEVKRDNLSDISEEEEVKIPPKDLTGI